MPAPATPSEAIAQRLLTDATVAALVSDRVFPVKPKQDPVGPYVVYFRQGGGDSKTMSGRGGLQAHEMRVECYAPTEAEAEAVLAACAARLAGDRGAGVAVWRDRGNGVQGCFAQADSDELVTDDGWMVSGQTFSLWFKPQT